MVVVVIGWTLRLLTSLLTRVPGMKTKLPPRSKVLEESLGSKNLPEERQEGLSLLKVQGQVTLADF